MSAGVVSTDIVRALAYHTGRDLLRRLRRLLGRPLRLLLVTAIIAGLGALQVRALSAADSDVVTLPPWSGALLAVAFAAAAIGGTVRAPIRLRTPDAAWLLPSPGGARTLLVWHLLANPVRFALFGLAAGAVAALRTGDVDASTFQPAVALPCLALLLRSTGYLAFVLTVRAVPKVLAAGAIAGTWVLAGLPELAAVVDRPLPDALASLTAGPRAVTDAVVAAIASPTPDGWLALLVAVIVAVIAATAVVALSRGYQDPAARQAWEYAELTAAYQDGSIAAGAVQELIATKLTKGLPSLTGLASLQGEWALLWRALAQLRRSWRWEIRTSAVLAGAAIVLAVVAPPLSPIPFLLLLVTELPGTRSGFVTELTYHAIRTLPGSALRKTLAVDTVPTASAMVELLLVALPPILVLSPGAASALTGVLSLTGLAAAIVASGSLAALAVPTLGRRMLLSALLTTGAIGATAVTTWTLPRWPLGLLVGAAWATAAWLGCARLLHRPPRTVAARNR